MKQIKQFDYIMNNLLKIRFIDGSESDTITPDTQVDIIEYNNLTSRKVKDLKIGDKIGIDSFVKTKESIKAEFQREYGRINPLTGQVELV